MSTPSIRFGARADATSDAKAWQELARKVESLGFDALYVADHPGVTASPFAALASAAAVTSTLRLGTYVCNAGVRDPVALAGEVVTFDGEYVATDEAFLLAPRPVQSMIPLLVGGNGTQLLRPRCVAGRHRELDGLGPHAGRRPSPHRRLERRVDRRPRLTRARRHG